jgi:hypothetical protein
MFKTVRQIITNLLLIFILEDLIRWGVRVVRKRYAA